MGITFVECKDHVCQEVLGGFRVQAVADKDGVLRQQVLVCASIFDCPERRKGAKGKEVECKEVKLTELLDRVG